MDDDIIIKKISKETNRTTDEVKKILNRVDSKLLYWIKNMDGLKISMFIPLIFSNTITSNYLIIKLLKTLKSKKGEKE